MKFKVDENLPVELAKDLRRGGHEAESVVDEGLAGASDTILLGRVKVEQEVFFTLDKRIADVRSHPPSDFAGIVLFRPPTSGKGAVLSFVRRHLARLLRQPLAGRLWVVSERGIRVR
ncbi:MAG: DUF5615 family PIN-like protein [Planctomycetes bacterium]|nr:DUF5615 family PIN-like protein [Planctomycetota bacterium]